MIGAISCRLLLVTLLLNPLPVPVATTSPSGTEKTREEAVRRLVEQLMKGSRGEMTLAVGDFLTLHGEATELGRFLGEELTAQLFLTRRFVVRETNLLNRVLEQIALAKAPVFDPSTMEKLGKILNIDAVVTGSIVHTGISIRLNVRMINTRGEVIAGALAEYIQDSQDEILLDRKMPR